ncbi:acetylxylan esterase, partial [bacterium]|nr:acetylxylan esterase [bacterium]
MTHTFGLLTTVGILLIAFVALAVSTADGANYDENKVPKYTLPDPLVLANGDKVTDAKTWAEKRRPEIL